MPYYEVTYTQKRGSIALDGLLDQSGVVITTQDSFTLLSHPTAVGSGDVIDALGDFSEGVIILFVATPPAVGSDLVTSEWTATVKAVELIALDLATPLDPASIPPPDFLTVLPWDGVDFTTSPIKVFNEAWADDNLIIWRNNRSYAIPDAVYPHDISISFESTPDTSYTVTGMVAKTTDGTAHAGLNYMRILRNFTTSVNPGVRIPYTFINNANYEVKVWARVPTISATTQVLCVRHDLTTYGVSYLNETLTTIPRDNTWREYTLNFTISTPHGIDNAPSNSWWIQHEGAQNDANGYLDIDDVTITYLGIV